MNILIYIFILFIFSCGTSQDSPVPYIPVDLRINLNDLRHQNLQRNGGYIYFFGGIRGIIVYRKSASVYYAFERNCTFDPLAECAQVSADESGLFMLDKCCGSQFDFEGNPISGVATVPLLRYRTTVLGNELHITN